MFIGSDQIKTAQVRDFVQDERKKSLSDREWKHRLAGYGYDVRNGEDCLKLVTLSKGIELCDLPLDRPAH